MIKRHHRLSYLRKDLARSSGTSWIAQAPADLAEGFIWSQAALAAWVSQVRPDLLDKPSVGVLILGTLLDSFDNGAWWTLFPAMLEKPLGWAKIAAAVSQDDGSAPRSGIAPASLRQAVRIVRGDMVTLAELDLGEIDLVYLPAAGADAWVTLLGHEKHGMWKFLDQKAELVIGLLEANEAGLSSVICSQYDLEPRTLTNRFFDPSVPKDVKPQAGVLVSVRGTRPPDLKLADDHATNISEVLDVIKELCAPSIDGTADDFRLWGIRSLLKSSVDASDHYVSLPRQFAVRLSTGRVYRVQEDLAVGEAIRCSFPPEAIADWPGEDSHWTARVFWAGRAWECGLGDFYRNSVGATFDKFGVRDTDIGSLIDRIGGSSEESTRLKNSMTGGPKYSPTAEERRLFDLVDKRDEDAVVAMVRGNGTLANAINEDRSPLLVMLGLRNMPGAMEEVIDLGADPDGRDGGERPVLVELAGRAGVEAVDVLLNAGADPNSCDAMGWTALLYSLKMKRWESAQMLLDWGADPQQANGLGTSPRGLAAGERTEMDRLSERALSLMKSLTDAHDLKAFKAAAMNVEPSDIPQSLRDQLLAT